MSKNYGSGEEPCNNSILRACFIFDLFTPEKNTYTLKEIANACGISSTTAIPILRALELSGFLERNPENKLYSLGMKFVEKSNIKLNSLNIVDISSPHLKNFSHSHGVNTHLGVLEGNEIIYLARHQSTVQSLIPSHVGKHIPIYSSAMGKAILANLDVQRAEDALANTEFHKFTAFTKDSKDALMKEFPLIRQLGYAVEREEYQIGGCCGAVPIFNARNKVCAAISFSLAKSSEKYAHMDEYLEDFRLVGAEISRELGCTL